MQAQFLIPMAVSIAAGVLAATLVSLLIVPAAYMALHDMKRLLQRRSPLESPAVAEAG